MTSPAPPYLMNVNQAGQYLSVSSDTIRRLIRKGDFPHMRVRNSIRIRKNDLDTYLLDMTTTQWERVDGRGGYSR